jgi:hypothetical protein
MQIAEFSGPGSHARLYLCYYWSRALSSGWSLPDSVTVLWDTVNSQIGHLPDVFIEGKYLGADVSTRMSGISFPRTKRRPRVQRNLSLVPLFHPGQPDTPVQVRLW